MPPIEVDVEHGNRSGGQTRQKIPANERIMREMRFQLKLVPKFTAPPADNLLLVVRQRQGPYSAAAYGERVQRGQIERPPHFDNSPVAGCHQVFTVSRQQDALHLELGPIKLLLLFRSQTSVRHSALT